MRNKKIGVWGIMPESSVTITFVFVFSGEKSFDICERGEMEKVSLAALYEVFDWMPRNRIHTSIYFSDVSPRNGTKT